MPENISSENIFPEKKISAETINLAERFKGAARQALEGKDRDVLMQTSGSLHLFNSGKMLIYQGYTPEQEYLKGLICAVEEDLKIIAPCLPKFYNLGEKPENDQRFFSWLQQEGVRAYFPEKIDGTNIRFYINPDTQEAAAATRGMIDGGKDDEDEGWGGCAKIHFGREALLIAREKYPDLLDGALLERFTPVLELIHPDNRIVTNYGDLKDLILLSVFDKSQGCRELTRKEMEDFAATHHLNLAATFSVDTDDWDKSLAQLRAMWQGTDKEGTVATLESGNEVVFRIKIKSSYYLELMRVMKSCTLNRTEALAEEWGVGTWETFREKIHAEYPDLSEEVMMGYETHFRIYERYIDYIQEGIMKITADYEAFVKEHAGTIETQKDFAFAISDRPDKALFFLLRKLGLDGARVKMKEQLKRQVSLREYSEKN